MRYTFVAAFVPLLFLSPALAQDAAVPTPSAPPATAPAPSGRLTGHILCDDTHRPARGALVSVVRADDAQGAFKGFADMSLTHVRADGTYLIEHLPPGRYTVFANLAGYLSAMDDAIAADPHLGASPKMQQLLDQLGTATVTPGATATLDVTLQRGAAVSGRVLFSDGSPAASVNLLMEDAKAASSTQNTSPEDQMEQAIAGNMFKRQSHTTDDQGHFRLAGLRPGSYRIAATQPQWHTDPNSQGREEMGMVIFGIADPRALRVYAGNTVHRLNATVFDLGSGDEVTGVDITLPVDAFHDLRGTVGAKDGRTVNMGQVTLQDTVDSQFTFHANITTDGTFLLQQVPAGTYTLTTANAGIGEPVPVPAGVPDRFGSLKQVAAFADGSLSIIVKDSDVEGLSLTLSEVPMPKTEPAPANDDQ